MPIKTYVTTCDLKDVNSLKTEETEILPTLGPEEDAIAVQLQELFDSVAEAVTPSLKTEGQLTIEVTGSVSLKLQGGIKYLFFNIGGETANTGTMKVVLSSKLKPSSENK